MSVILSMNNGWSFHYGDIPLKAPKRHGEIYDSCKAGSCQGAPQSDFDARNWETVNLPHDFSIKLPFDKNGAADWGYKPRGKAWYRKLFMIPPQIEGKRLELEFDGVATYCTVYFNGSILYRSYSGYAPFTVDITDRAVFGAANVLAVYVDADAFEGWWYEGAGIYRDVRLTAKEAVSVRRFGTHINPVLSNGKWSVNIETTLENRSDEKARVQVVTEIEDKKGEVYAFTVSKPSEIPMGETAEVTQIISAENPELWSPDSPYLYTAVSRIYGAGNELLDEVKTPFGFRDIKVSPAEGFILNGKRLKLLGVCCHQDHGGIGTAVPERVLEYRIKRLKEMGANAYRCAHGMPSPKLLDVCDRLGMLVMDENRNFETSEEVLNQLRTMVLRDRNHPSVVMYSIFNEEPLQGTPQGQLMTKRMIKEIRRLDDSRPVTGAMHGGILDIHGAASAMDICGINYQFDSIEAFHEKNPEIPIVCSETTSSFSVRGCYRTDKSKHEIAGYDEEYADWGCSVRETWAKVLSKDYIAGAFVWTGFDYLGEPSPFEYPSVSSFFGMMDVCGFEKYGFLLSKAIFSKEPFCRMLPHWNFKEGENVRVMSFTNCEEAELFVNGRSKGRKHVIKTEQVYWNVVFEEGEAEIRGYIKNKLAASEKVRTAGKPYRIMLKGYSPELYDDGSDAMTVDISVTDDKGIIVPYADNSVKITAAGGKVLGYANGDPNSHEDFTGNVHKVFHGMAQCVVAMNRGHKAGMKIFAEAEGLAPCELSVKSERNPEALPVLESIKEQYIRGWRISRTIFDTNPGPDISAEDCDMNSWEPIAVENGVSPLFAGQKGKYAVYRANTNIRPAPNGKTPIIHFHRLWGRCEIYINGELRAASESDWGMEMDLPVGKITGDMEITVICQSTNDFGGGVTASVVIRE